MDPFYFNQKLAKIEGRMAFVAAFNLKKKPLVLF